MSATDRRPEPPGPSKVRVLVFGTADLTKPRVRLLLEGLRLEGVETVDCTRNIWSGVADKSQVRSKLSMLGLALNWLWSMLVLSLRYLAAPKHDVVLVCYPGNLDLWFIRPLAWLRRKPVVWDAFLSAYDTIVLDRKMAKPGSLIGRLAYALDWCACRLCDGLFLDTPSHARFFEDTFALPRNSVGVVPVGAEALFLQASQPEAQSKSTPGLFKVLFYGQLIPLHGTETILEAAEQLVDAGVAITLVGRGQQSKLVADWKTAHPEVPVETIEWIDYSTLPAFMDAHHVCLGIFSAGDKADRVVPNKVYQVLARRKPLITRKSAAMADFIEDGAPGITLVPPADPSALATAILKARDAWRKDALEQPGEGLIIGPSRVGRALERFLSTVTDKH